MQNWEQGGKSKDNKAASAAAKVRVQIILDAKAALRLLFDFME